MPVPVRLVPISPARVLPFGDARLDARLPGGGLPLGAMHEIHAAGIERQTGALAGAFAALLLGRLQDRTGPVLWIAPVCDLYAPGLLAYGLDPGRLVMVRTQTDTETLGAMELALREGGAAAVLGEIAALPRLPARRLRLACLKQGVTAFVLRRQPFSAARTARDGTAAATRWRITPAPSITRVHEPGPARWRVELLYARGGREGAWIMEVADASDALRVVAELGNFTTAPPARHAARHG